MDIMRYIPRTGKNRKGEGNRPPCRTKHQIQGVFYKERKEDLFPDSPGNSTTKESNDRQIQGYDDIQEKPGTNGRNVSGNRM
jgi:hypothetical protein